MRACGAACLQTQAAGAAVPQPRPPCLCRLALPALIAYSIGLTLYTLTRRGGGDISTAASASAGTEAEPSGLRSMDADTDSWGGSMMGSVDFGSEEGGFGMLRGGAALCKVCGGRGQTQTRWGEPIPCPLCLVSGLGAAGLAGCDTGCSCRAGARFLRNRREWWSQLPRLLDCCSTRRSAPRLALCCRAGALCGASERVHTRSCEGLRGNACTTAWHSSSSSPPARRWGRGAGWEEKLTKLRDANEPLPNLIPTCCCIISGGRGRPWPLGAGLWLLRRAAAPRPPAFLLLALTLPFAHTLLLCAAHVALLPPPLVPLCARPLRRCCVLCVWALFLFPAFPRRVVHDDDMLPPAARRLNVSLVASPLALRDGTGLACTKRNPVGRWVWGCSPLGFDPRSAIWGAGWGGCGGHAALCGPAPWQPTQTGPRHLDSTSFLRCMHLCRCTSFSPCPFLAMLPLLSYQQRVPALDTSALVRC